MPAWSAPRATASFPRSAGVRETRRTSSASTRVSAMAPSGDRPAPDGEDPAPLPAPAARNGESSASRRAGRECARAMPERARPLTRRPAEERGLLELRRHRREGEAAVLDDRAGVLARVDRALERDLHLVDDLDAARRLVGRDLRLGGGDGD